MQEDIQGAILDYLLKNGHITPKDREDAKPSVEALERQQSVVAMTEKLRDDYCIKQSMQEAQETQNHEVLKKTEQCIILCPKNNAALQLCMSQGCDKCATSCARRDCQCLSAYHQECNFTIIDSFVRKALSKKKQLSEEEQKALDTLDGIYDQLAQQISLQKQELRVFREYFGMNVYQTQVMHYLAIGQMSQLTGDLVSMAKSKGNCNFGSFIQKEIRQSCQESCAAATKILKKLKKTIYPNQDYAPIKWGVHNPNPSLQVYGRILIYRDIQLAIKPISLNFKEGSKNHFWGFKVLKIQGTVYFGVCSLYELIQRNWKSGRLPYITCDNSAIGNEKIFEVHENDCFYVRYDPSNNYVTFINSRSNKKQTKELKKLSNQDYYCPYVGFNNHSAIQIVQQIPRNLEW